MQSTAKAHPNIALVKYWGKADPRLNLPAVGSISLTLRELHTISTVRFGEEIEKDNLILNGRQAADKQVERVSHFLDIIRKMAGIGHRARVSSENNFPTGAGLASSASAFASLTVAASSAAGLNLSPGKLSEIARMGSGSAARSIFGGFVEMKTGQKADGSDAVAIQLEDEHYWDLQLLIAITSEQEKETTSGEGMIHTSRTSPFYGKWLYSSQRDLEEMRAAVFTRNFPRLGEIAEHNCLKMHAVMMSARPGLIYWTPPTLEIIRSIRNMRRRDIPVYFTIDAGPQVKALCTPQAAAEIGKTLQRVEGVKRVIECTPGPGTTLAGN